MKRATAKDIFRIDEAATLQYAMPSLLLMENAGHSVADVICRDVKPCRVLIFSGKGNNGGDGLVLARFLARRGFAVEVVLLEDPSRLKPDPLVNFHALRQLSIPIYLMSNASEEDLLGRCLKSDLVVDAIFGVGLARPVQGVFARAIRAINGSLKPVFSIDMPSGLDADTGVVHGIAVKAAKAVTLAIPKAGLFEGEGPQYSGEIEVVDIGIPRELLQPFLD